MKEDHKRLSNKLSKMSIQSYSNIKDNQPDVKNILNEKFSIKEINSNQQSLIKNLESQIDFTKNSIGIEDFFQNKHFIHQNISSSYNSSLALLQQIELKKQFILKWSIQTAHIKQINKKQNLVLRERSIPNRKEFQKNIPTELHISNYNPIINKKLYNYFLQTTFFPYIKKNFLQLVNKESAKQMFDKRFQVEENFPQNLHPSLFPQSEQKQLFSQQDQLYNEHFMRRDVQDNVDCSKQIYSQLEYEQQLIHTNYLQKFVPEVQIMGHTLDQSQNGFLAIAQKCGIMLFDEETDSYAQVIDQQYFEFLNANNYQIQCVKWLNDNILSYGTTNCELIIQDLVKQKNIQTFKNHENLIPLSGITCISILNQNIITSSGHDGNIFSYDLRTKNVIQSFKKLILQSINPHKGLPVMNIQWNQEGNLLGAAYLYGKIGIFNQFSIKPIVIIKEHNSHVKALNWNPYQHNMLVSGGLMESINNLVFYDASRQKVLYKTSTGYPINDIQWCNRYALACCFSKFSSIKLFKYNNQSQSMELYKLFKGHLNDVIKMTINRNNKFLYSYDSDGILNFFKLSHIEKNNTKLNFTTNEILNQDFR